MSKEMGVKSKVDEFVGKRGYTLLGGLEVEVKVVDYKRAYGKDRFLVTPVAGTGKVWVEVVALK